MSIDRTSISEQNGELTLENVPASMLRELERLANQNGTSASHEAAKIVQRHLEIEAGDEANS